MKLVAGLKFAYIQLAKLAVIVRLLRRNGFDLMVKTQISHMQLVCQSSGKNKKKCDRKIFFSVPIFVLVFRCNFWYWQNILFIQQNNVSIAKKALIVLLYRFTMGYPLHASRANTPAPAKTRPAASPSSP